MKRGLLFGLSMSAVALSVILCGCSFPLKTTSYKEAQMQITKQPVAELSVPTIHENGVLKVGLLTSMQGAPDVIKTDKGSITGLDVDVASALADELGLKVQFVSVSDNAQDISNVDVVMDVKDTNKNGLSVVGSYKENGVAFYRKGSAQVATKDELSGKTVAVQTGSLSQDLLHKSNLNMTEKGYANLNDAFNALNSGNVDFVLCDSSIGAYMTTVYSGLGFAGSINTPVAYGVGVNSSNSALSQAVNSALEKLKNNGVLALIQHRWLGDSQGNGDKTQVKGVEIKQQSTSTADGGNSTTGVSVDDAGSNAANIN